MPKPKKVVLPDGSIIWDVYFREGGRGSKAIHRRFPTSKEAQSFIDDFQSEQKTLRQGVIKVGSFYETTFRGEAENWLEDLKLRTAPGHYRRCKYNIDDFNKNYGNLEPNKVTPEFLTSLQRKLKLRPGKKPETFWANASVNRYTEAICSVLSFSAAQKRIPFNPVAGFKKLPKSSPEMLFWDEQEASSFLAWAHKRYTEPSNKSRAKARKNYLAYLIAINTGMRAGEIWGLKPYDLVFSNDGSGDTIFVRRQFNAVERAFLPLKGGLSADKDKSRHVPCPGELRKELEVMIQFNKIRGDATVFQSVSGEPFNHDAFADRFDRDVKRWGGRRIRFHDLRHTAATLMLSKGIDVKTVSEILGHEDLATTMIYVHLLGDRIKQVSKSFFIQPMEPQRPRLHLVANP
jgi:integrase